MKYLLSLFLSLFTVQVTSAQLKIDPAYALIMKDSVYKNGTNIIYGIYPDSMAIREEATGKTCRIVSAEWIFSIRGEIYRDVSPEQMEYIKMRLGICKPKDIIFIDRIKLADGCFIPPRQITFGVK